MFFHLIPHAFMGGASEDPTAAASGSFDPEGVRLIVVEEKRNVILGVSLFSSYNNSDTDLRAQAAIFGGFFAFFLLDKTMRVLAATSGGESSHHNHHHHHQVEATEKVEAKSSAIEKQQSSSSELRYRTNSGTETEQVVGGTAQDTQKQASASLKLSAYLNLFGDFSKWFHALLRVRTLLNYLSIWQLITSLMAW